MYEHKINGIILKFLNLGHAVHLFKPFAKVESTVGAIIFPLDLTRSPLEPNFTEWWEQNKEKWKICEKCGQELVNSDEQLEK